MKKLSIIMLILTISISAASCQTTGKNELVSIGSYSVSAPEFLLYLQNTKTMFEAEGDGTDIWDTFFDDIAAPDKAKEVSINSLIAVKIANIQAKKANISLTSEEIDSAHLEGDKLVDKMTDEKIRKIGASHALIYKVMEEKAIYMKMYESVTKNFVMSDSDFNLYFELNKDNFQTLDILSIKFFEEDDAIAFLEDVKNEDRAFFEEKALAINSSVGDFSSDFFYKYGTYGEAFDRVVYSLNINDTALIELDDGYCVVYLIGKFPDTAQKLEAEVKNAYIAENKNKIFQSELSKWQTDVAITKNDAEYNKVDIKSLEDY